MLHSALLVLALSPAMAEGPEALPLPTEPAPAIQRCLHPRKLARKDEFVGPFCSAWAWSAGGLVVAAGPALVAAYAYDWDSLEVTAYFALPIAVGLWGGAAFGYHRVARAPGWRYPVAQGGGLVTGLVAAGVTWAGTLVISDLVVGPVSGRDSAFVVGHVLSLVTVPAAAAFSPAAWGVGLGLVAQPNGVAVVGTF